MTRFRGRRPATPLGWVQLCALVLGLVMTLSQAGSVDRSLASPRPQLAGAGLACLVAVIFATHLRQRLLPLEPVLSPVLAVVVGAAFADPLAVTGIPLGLTAALTLFGPLRLLVVRAVLLAAVVPVSAALAPAPGSWHDQNALGIVPVVLTFTALMRAFVTTLARQQQSQRREAVLARAGRRLIGMTDIEAVTAVLGEAAHELVDDAPDLRMVFAMRDGDRLEVRTSFGRDAPPEGTRLPLGLVARVDPDDVETTVRLDGDSRALDLASGRRLPWYGIGGGFPDAEVYGLIVARQPEEFDAVRMLLTQFSLAMANCQAVAELAHRAHHDELTTMPNRAAFFARLAAEVDAATGGPSGVALLVVDLDDFKQVNDSYGHAAGDGLLVEVARRMTEVVGDHGLPARFGGDEFAVLLHGIEDADQAVRVARELRERLLRPVRLPEAVVTVGSSIGLAVHTPGTTAGDLIRCADIAMYSAKARGKNRVELFSADRHGQIAQLRLLEEHLATAIAQHEITLHYQPIVDLKTGRCAGVEALARWLHPTLGVIDPATFIPLAERSGYARLLGDAVLRSACLQGAGWGSLPGGDQLRITVNLFGRQLTEPGFVETVREHLAVSGLPPHRLWLELAETELLDDAGVRAQLDALAALGVRIALDDFGTGYASLAGLQAVPVHQLKLDRRLLLARDDERADAMVQLIMSVSGFLGLETVAEAVETPEHADWARRIGIPLAQGWLFARPMPPADFPTWLATNAPSGARSPFPA